jgi:hypothetical protein
VLTLAKELLSLFKPSNKVCLLCEEHTAFGKYAKVYGSWGWHCQECISWGSNTKWEGDSNNGIAAFSSKETSIKPYVYVPACGHNLTPLKLPDGHTIFLSGTSHLKSEAEGTLPTAAVYLDTLWTAGQAFSNDGTVTAAEDEIATLVVQWPDFKAIELDTLKRALEWAQQQLDAGEDLEVGCIGGHGRTGSFAAALCITQGLSAEEAVLYVKSHYCTKAIETPAQREMLASLYHDVLYVEAQDRAL